MLSDVVSFRVILCY